MQKKKLVGLVGLALVVLMTIFAYFLPGEAKAADTHTDVIRVTVYDQYPSVTINEPENESVTVSPEVEIGFDYENSQTVKMTLSYQDEEGNTQTIELPDYTPSDLDPTFNYASGNDTVTLDLTDYGLTYGRYILTLETISAVGSDTQSTEFYYLPAKSTQTGTSEENNDPIVNVEYDQGVEKIEIIPVDENGDPLFDEPIIIEVPEPFDAGSEEVIIPFSSYGIESGDYHLIINAYSKNEETGEYERIPAPTVLFEVSYTQPEAPAIPNTGRLLSNLDVSSSDLMITSLVVFSFAVLVAFIILNRKENDRRKDTCSKDN